MVIVGAAVVSILAMTWSGMTLGRWATWLSSVLLVAVWSFAERAPFGSVVSGAVVCAVASDALLPAERLPVPKV